jgi:hypothetical protein
VAVATAYFAKLGVNMIEEDDEDDLAYASRAPVKSFTPNLLEIGVDAASYNRARRASIEIGESDGGYMSVGVDMAGLAVDDDDWD